MKCFMGKLKKYMLRGGLITAVLLITALIVVGIIGLSGLFSKRNHISNINSTYGSTTAAEITKQQG